MKTSARNVFQGVVKKIVRGAVNAEVTLQLPGGMEIVAIITITSLDDLKLKEGSPASAIIKASNVLLAVD
ncbi:MAG: molybdopterin-binding protein [Chloroflexota bacterium]|jgi:molybdate transport system regulatory protein